ncbi:MAG: DMT family transporter [Spongiibacteraceae bacterium]
MNAITLHPPNASAQHRGIWLCGLFGIAGFSLTLPMTRLALTAFDPIVLTLGRALIAAVLSAVVLFAARQKIPPFRCWWRFAVVSAGVIYGFPLLSSMAMQQVPASHGAAITGLTPLVTALIAVLRGDERPSSTQWATLFGCCLVVLAFAVASGAGRVQAADLLMFAAVIVVGIGYAEGALLARQFGYWQTICWALLLSVPVSVAGLVYHGVQLPSLKTFSDLLPALGGFMYLGTISMFAAFMLWYRGLALGGIARVGQLQFLQPFMTIAAASLLFGEALHARAIACVCGISLLILVGNNFKRR